MFDLLDNWVDISTDYFFDHPALHWVVALAFVIYAIVAENPYESGTSEHRSLMFCRIGLGCFALSWLFGLLGLVLAVTSFIMGVLALSKRLDYGAFLVLGSLCSALFCILFIDLRPL
jgi:hypothetical protein